MEENSIEFNKLIRKLINSQTFMLSFFFFSFFFKKGYLAITKESLAFVCRKVCLNHQKDIVLLKHALQNVNHPLLQDFPTQSIVGGFLGCGHHSLLSI